MEVDEVDKETEPPVEVAEQSRASTMVETEKSEEPDEVGQEDIQQDATSVLDTRPYPRPFESLRAFFGRTTASWQDDVMRHLEGSGQQQSIKELRKTAFAHAEARWWDLREEIRTEEERLEEAGGIGEVVSLSELSDKVGAGKRR